MVKTIFDLCFSKTKQFTCENVNFDTANNMGTCRLISRHRCYLLIWSITNYPSETAGLPGAPYPIKVSYTLLDRTKCDSLKDSLKSISGEFVYALNGGTLPNNSELGVPKGNYHSIGRNNNNEHLVSVLFELNDNSMVVTVRGKC